MICKHQSACLTNIEKLLNNNENKRGTGFVQLRGINEQNSEVIFIKFSLFLIT